MTWFLAILFTFSVQVSADVTVEGITFPETKVIDGKTLYLNGAGLRQVNYFGINIDVYVAGLYLENNSTDLQAIRDDDGLKYLHSVWLRGVSKRKQKGPWKDGMRENCYKDCDSSKTKIRTLARELVDSTKGGILDIIFYKDKIKYLMKGDEVSKGELEGAAFSKDLLNLWIGPKPASRDMREAFQRGKADSLKEDASKEKVSKEKPAKDKNQEASGSRKTESTKKN